MSEQLEIERDARKEEAQSREPQNLYPDFPNPSGGRSGQHSGTLKGQAVISAVAEDRA